MSEEIKILCVDDEPNVLNALRRLFMDEEYEILTAPSAQDGISTLEKEEIQLVISDYRMPSMNGVEFLREVYRRWPNTVRIVLSGYADASAIVGAINDGHIYKFIPKPWNDDELKVTISNAIERYFLFKKNKELTQELKEKNEELEKLLKEKSRSLEFRTKSLSSYQELLDSMPIGILGIDDDDMIVMCNSLCTEIIQEEGVIGRDLAGISAGAVKKFFSDVRTNMRFRESVSIHGNPFRMIGSVIPGKGVIAIFVPEGDCR